MFEGGSKSPLMVAPSILAIDVSNILESSACAITPMPDITNMADDATMAIRTANLVITPVIIFQMFI